MWGLIVKGRSNLGSECKGACVCARACAWARGVVVVF